MKAFNVSDACPDDYAFALLDTAGGGFSLSVFLWLLFRGPPALAG